MSEDLQELEATQIAIGLAALRCVRHVAHRRALPLRLYLESHPFSDGRSCRERLSFASESGRTYSLEPV